MKNIFNLMSLVAIAILIFSGCNKDNIVNEQQDVVLNFNVETSSGVGNTKAVKTGWENNDKLYLVFGYFNADDDLVFAPNDYIILTYNLEDAKWNVTKGQDVLNNITAESGYVDVGFCSGTPTVCGEEVVLSNAGKNLFLLKQGAVFVKTDNVITISDEDTGGSVVLSNGMVQFNVKIPYATYSKVVMKNFYLFGVIGESIVASGYSDIKFNKDGIRKVKNDYVVGDYPAQQTSDENEMAFFFQPDSWDFSGDVIRIKLIITIGGTDYTISKDFTNLVLSKDHCYSINGPTEDIATTAVGASLGNGWIRN